MDDQPPTERIDRDEIEAAFIAAAFAMIVENACSHNAMIERSGDAEYAWQCADCGHVYGR